jgi:hypothetical protein
MPIGSLDLVEFPLECQIMAESAHGLSKKVNSLCIL